MRIPLISMICLLAACAASEDPTGTPMFQPAEFPGLTDHHASTGGVSWADIDGDGDADLLVTNGFDVSEEPAGQPNRLYRNDDGVLAPVTQGPLAESVSISSGNTWGDYDGDGDLDVYITNQQGEDNLLYRNDGDWNFTRITDGPMVADGGHSYTAAWVDVDNDGRLDLFVANGGMSHVGVNRLYRNVGGGSFEVISDGGIVTDEAATCGVAWGDYDDDGDLDAYVVNTGFSPPGNVDTLYRNDGDFVFTRVEDTVLTEDGAATSGAQWVDVDNDLDLDLSVTVMYGLANLLYVNEGGKFVRADAGDLVLDSGYTYTMNFEDYDNDGDLDAIAGEWGGSLALYLNDGTGEFLRAPSINVAARIVYTGAMASADFDGDGRVDVLVGNWPNRPGPGERNFLMVNTAPGRHWLSVRIDGVAIGARVVVTTAAGSQMREIVSQHGFRGQSSAVAHFGLGDAERAESVEVRFPSGGLFTAESVESDQVLVVTRP